jgi:hypothetical protein
MFHRRKHSSLYLLVPFLVLLALPLPATTVYWNSTDWQANTSSFSTIDFESTTPASYSTAAGLTVDSVQFIGYTGGVPANFLYAFDPSTDPSQDFGTGKFLKGPFQTASPGYLQVNLPADVTSISFNLMTVFADSGEFAVTLSTGGSWSNIGVASRPDMAFFGATSDVPIAAVQIWQTAGMPYQSYPVYDNFSFGTAGVVGPPPEETPEVATLLMVGSGLFLVWRFRRRRIAQPLAA